MSQVHKANQHSGRASNLLMNRRYKRLLAAHVAPANRADRRLPKRLIYAANIAAIQAAAVEVALAAAVQAAVIAS